jgi:hypothetical protein
MTSQIGRNEPCPCGSGKKYKNCCFKQGILHNKKKQNKAALIVLGGVILIAGAISISKMTSSSPSPIQAPAGQLPLSSTPVLPNQTNSTAGIPNSPQPPGPVPPGKVWSTEHGHWHDVPVTTNVLSNNSTTTASSNPSTSAPIFDIVPQQLESQTQTPGTITPQPPGPAPAGKVWSAEHGHWHDAPVTGQVTPGVQPAQPGQLTPQPPGPAPAGKVWSAEHGHWHDAPVEPKVIQVNPSNPPPK